MIGKKSMKKAARAGKLENREELRRKKAVEANTERDNSFTNCTIEDLNGSDVKISLFDYSAEFHFRAMEMISKLCGEEEVEEASGASESKIEIERLSSAITFLTEWRHFNYNPKILNFSCETGSPQGKYVVNGIQLPPFSSATVPKMKGQSIDGGQVLKSNKDFVLHVGGSVWALDWCPRLHRRSDSHIMCEFLAVSAHPPEASHHKMGAPLTGRGIVQIWCLLNFSEEEIEKEELRPLLKKSSGGRPRKKKVTEENSPPPLKKPRGRPRKEKVIEETFLPSEKRKLRPRKEVLKESLDNLDSKSQFVHPLAFQFPEGSSQFPTVNELVDRNNNENAVVQGYNTTAGLETETPKSFNHGVSSSHLGLTSCKNKRKRKRKARSTENEDSASVAIVPAAHNSCGQEKEKLAMNMNAVSVVSCEEGSMTSPHLPNNVVLPRLVFCLAHNGKVAWDVKWQPSNGVNCSKYKHQMGYLAVLLGNGALEVWEVPSPTAIKVLYSSSHKGDIDPRFVKLEPVFRCSNLMLGDKQSIPLTLEWSTSSPHDLILAGCHDGTVALWKFSVTGSSQSTRPLLCFNAEIGPIRAIAWAPDEGDAENVNIMVTGHGGLRFWDIRDPYRPLWDLNPVRRVVYGLEWLPHPRCIISSSDDGTLKIVSMLKAASAYDVPVTGKPFSGTQLQGLNSYNCSSFTIWSVHASRSGMVAYCCADGIVGYFELTTKAVEKDHSRNRAPHFLCGSLTEENSILTVNTPLPYTPIPTKKSLKDGGDTPRTISGISDLNRSVKGKNKTSNDRTLVLHNRDDSDMGFGSLKTPDTPKRKKPQKPKASRKNKLDSDEAGSAGGKENPHGEEDKKGEGWTEMEVIPPKIVGLHRVRWNMNKGSERWLCYGGAAGIVRCQEIRHF